MTNASIAYLPVQPQPRIANILFPTDFSPCSQIALPYACMLANQHGATLHLINVVGQRPLVGPLGVPYAEVEHEDNGALRELDSLGKSPAIKALRHECSIHRGTVWEIVCRLVDNWAVDLVVMATHGRTGVRQFVLGSVAEQVFRHVRCPVLTIGPGANKLGPALGRFSTILAATDLSPGSGKVLEYAHAFSIANKSILILFHAIPEHSELTEDHSTYLDVAVTASKKQLLEMVPTDVPRTDVCIKIGTPAESILQAAEDRNADLVVIGARRGVRLAAHNPWAVAHEVVCGASCPVLTVGH